MSAVIRKITSFDIGKVNMACCCLHDGVIKHWDVFPAMTTLDLVKQLDERPWLLEADAIVLEKQPSFNPKMRIVAGAVRCYFTVRKHDRGLAYSIYDYSPRMKLQCYDGPVPDFGMASEYAERKKVAVYQCRELLKKDQSRDLAELFEASKKKDDLADAFLQALSFEKTGPDLKKPLGKRAVAALYSRAVDVHRLTRQTRTSITPAQFNDKFIELAGAVDAGIDPSVINVTDGFFRPLIKLPPPPKRKKKEPKGSAIEEEGPKG